MSFYNPTASFSKPKTYDPSLAKRSAFEDAADNQLSNIAERIAEKQRRSIREELGLSDEESLYSEDEEAKDYSGDDLQDSVVREEFTQLKQRYMAALQDIHEKGESERKAVEQLSKLKQMSKSQITILTHSFKEKLHQREELVEELLNIVQIQETKLTEARLTNGESSYQNLRSEFDSQKESDKDLGMSKELDSNTKEVSLPQAEELSVLKKQVDSIQAENRLLRQCLSDLMAGEVPTFSEQQLQQQQSQMGRESNEVCGETEETPQTPSSKNGAFSNKLNNLSSEALKGKLVKALKVAKTSQVKLAAAEQEKVELLSLLSEARAELENRRSQETELVKTGVVQTAAVPPAAPREISTDEEVETKSSKAEKTEKVKEKIEKMKRKLQETEAECESLKVELSSQNKELEILRNQPKAPPPVDTTSFEKRIRDLESALETERRSAKLAKANLASKQKNFAQNLQQIQKKFAEEKTFIRNTKKDLQNSIQSAQKDIFTLVKQLKAKVDEKEDSLSGIVTKYQREYKERKRLFNLVQELRGNIRVLCRVRPALDFEKDDVVVKFPEDGAVEVKNPKGREKQWEFDHVFKSNTSNEDVFNQVSDLCTSILDGYNVCIFAYGQTGSGKTHTMEGPEHDPGVNFRALAKLFENMNERKNGGEWTFEVQVSLLEIYNEQIRDLLGDKNKQKKLEVKAGPHGMHVPGLTMVSVTDHTQVIKLMTLGKKNRAVACTDMNSHSSRSHSMLSTYIVARNSLTNEEARGKLHLIDLAGSERVSKSGVQGARLAEATNINKSLSALGDVIQARANKQGHVPYRNSTLTYLLQDSLSADSKTLMFVQCSPVATNAGETVCSLNFAARARQVELGKAAKHVSK